MKTITIISSMLLVACFSNLRAQQYTPMLEDNKIWNFTTETYPQPPDNPGDTSTMSYMLSGDTVINSTSYHILHQINCWEIGNDIQNQTPIAYLREDSANQKVFQYIDGQDLLLYDFSVEVDDTLHGEDYAFEDIYDLVVTDTDSALINGTYRKIISFEVLTGTVWSSTWTEGIGATPLLNYIAGDTWYTKSLNCLFENGTLVFHNPYYASCCPATTGIMNEMAQSGNLSLYPNPAKDNIHIRLNHSQSAKLTIFSIHGKLVYQGNIKNGTADISVSHLDTGLYVAKITGNFGIVSRKLSLK